MSGDTKPGAGTHLRRLMDEVARARSLDAVYDSALSCLRSALKVERASVLVMDERQVMRFVAWVGLSDRYRRAVEGHSPWAPDQAEATPILVPDVRREESLAAYGSLFETEKIAALAFVPLRFAQRLLGKFMLYYGEPHTFSPEEVAIAELVAGHIAFALEHYRIERDLERRLVSERETRERAEREARLREEAETRARGNERRLRLALTAGRMGTWEWNIPTGSVLWSEELEAIHGFEPGRFPGTFEAFQRDLHPDDRTRVLEAIERAVREHASDHAAEYRILRTDRTERWVAEQGRVVLGEDGNPVAMVGVCSDITERKRMEQASQFLSDASRILATSLEHEATLESLSRLAVPYLADWCAIHVLDEAGEIVPVEVAHSDPANVALAWKITERWPTRRDAPFGAGLVIRTGEPSVLPRITHEFIASVARDDEHRRCLDELQLHSALIVPLKARGLTLGAMTLVSAESRREYGSDDLAFAEKFASRAALAIDNTRLFRNAHSARSAAERAREQVEMLAEASDRLAASPHHDAALGQLAQFVVATMADYCVTYAYDGRGIRRLGLSHRLPEKAPLVEALTEAGPPTVEDPEGTGAVVRTGEAILVSDVTDEFIERSVRNAAHLQAVRRLAPRSCIIVPLRARDHIIGAIALATTPDSDRRYTDADLRVAEELARRAALLIDNARLLSKAQAAIRARDEMLAIISHDLKNPLNTIVTACELLELDPPADRRARSRAGIRRAAKQMNRLLADLLEVARIDEGRLSVTLDAIDVAAVISEVASIFFPIAEDRSIRLEKTIEPKSIEVRADWDKLVRALSNVVSNALKFTPEGGQVHIRSEYHGDVVRIAVSDTGPGIPNEQMPHLFDRFWQGSPASRTGVGLGLSIAKGIVEAHGGRIDVATTVGEGTEFRIELPTRVPRVADPPGRKGDKRVVLVVDDDDAVRHEITELLEHHGYRVAGAAHGGEALDFLRDHDAPDLVLLDLIMPVMDGRDLFAAMKSDPRLRSIPLIIMTCVDEQYAGSPIEHAAGFLKKPFEKRRLLELAQLQGAGNRS